MPAMETFTYILTAILAVTLIGTGIFLCVRKGQQPVRPTTVAAVLSVGFLMLLLLHMSKFKHVKGFGFDAETWDEKQVQAAQLVDQLSSISEGLSRQVALLASRIGLWGTGLTNPELATLLRQTNAQLQATTTVSQINALKFWRPYVSEFRPITGTRRAISLIRRTSIKTKRFSKS
jgi:hypothetical protein